MKWQRLSVAAARKRAEEAAKILSRDERVELFYLFGSAADESQSAAGDIDLGLLTEPPLCTPELTDLRAELATQVGPGFDLVLLNRAPVALAHQVVEHGILLWARNPDIETEFVTRTRARYWDFKPLLEEQWRLAAERSKERLRGS